MIDIELVRDASPIEAVAAQYTQLTKIGNRLVGLCPFHSESGGTFTLLYHRFSSGGAMGKTYTVSQVAREVGRSEKRLREAECRGKIPLARRDFNGWRVYTDEDIESLKNLLAPKKVV